MFYITKFQLFWMAAFAVLLMMYSCKNDEKLPVDKIPEVQRIDQTSFLHIEGNDILVRETPGDGTVVMKLKNGTKCSVLQTGTVDTIRGAIDHWYQIKYKDSVGWVYGAQTTLKSAESIQAQSFLESIHLFVKALQKRDYEVMNSFIYENEPVHCVLGSKNSDHLRSAIVNDLREIETYYDFRDLLDTIQIMGEANQEIRHRSFEQLGLHRGERGFYYEFLPHGNNDISTYQKWQMEFSMAGDDLLKRLTHEFPLYLKREKEVQFRFVVMSKKEKDRIDDHPFSGTFQFFFYPRYGQWYLSGIYHPYVN